MFSNRLLNKILKASKVNKDDFTHLKAYNFQRNSKSYNRLLLWQNRGFNWSMSGKIKERFLLHEEKTWTRRRVLRNLNSVWKLIASQRSVIYQTKNNLVVLQPFPKLSAEFQRNRLPNVQDIKFFNVRSPPKFCLINLFMRSLSPAALMRKFFSAKKINIWESRCLYLSGTE